MGDMKVIATCIACIVCCREAVGNAGLEACVMEFGAPKEATACLGKKFARPSM